MNTTSGGSVLSQDFSEFLKLLNDSQAHYLLVGGYAVAFHGHPRYTKDLDIWVEPTRENAARVLQALDKFGFSSLEITIEDLIQSGQIIQLGYPPNRIDLITSASGIEFSDCYPARISARMDDVDLPFIDLENLKKNKKASGRLQDMADLEQLDH
jgi:hypothetical protein